MSSNTEKLKEIRDEIYNLKESPLYEYRTENKYFPVLGQGNHEAKIIFIGEAPGENEAKTGMPFCGAAGRVLDQLFENVGLNRNEVYITNIVKDRPPNNRDPKLEEIELYAPFLDRQIAIIKPEIIVTLGRFSMEYIFKRYGLKEELQPISKIHGKMYETNFDLFKIQPKIIALYHPAVALYNPSTKQTLLEDAEILKQFI